MFIFGVALTASPSPLLQISGAEIMIFMLVYCALTPDCWFVFSDILDTVTDNGSDGEISDPPDIDGG